MVSIEATSWDWIRGLLAQARKQIALPIEPHPATIPEPAGRHGATRRWVQAVGRALVIYSVVNLEHGRERRCVDGECEKRDPLRGCRACMGDIHEPLWCRLEVRMPSGEVLDDLARDFRGDDLDELIEDARLWVVPKLRAVLLAHQAVAGG